MLQGNACWKYAVSLAAGLVSLLFFFPAAAHVLNNAAGQSLFLQVFCVALSALHPDFHEAL